MKYKMAEDGKSVVVDEDGHPVVIKDDGSEFGIDAIGTYSKIPDLQAEAKKHRLAKKDALAQVETLQQKLSMFEGIEDPSAAKKAIETVQNFKDGDFIKAGEAENMKRQILEAHENKLKELKTNYETTLTTLSSENEQLKSTMDRTVLTSHFAKSKFIKDKLSIAEDITESFFGKHFKIEEVNGQRVPIAYIGENKLYSPSNPTEPAKFDEALSKLVEMYPNKESILKTNPGNNDKSRHNANQDTRDQGIKKPSDRIRQGLKDSGHY